MSADECSLPTTSVPMSTLCRNVNASPPSFRYTKTIPSFLPSNFRLRQVKYVLLRLYKSSYLLFTSDLSSLISFCRNKTNNNLIGVVGYKLSSTEYSSSFLLLFVVVVVCFVVVVVVIIIMFVVEFSLHRRRDPFLPRR